MGDAISGRGSQAIKDELYIHTVYCRSNDLTWQYVQRLQTTGPNRCLASLPRQYARALVARNGAPARARAVHSARSR